VISAAEHLAIIYHWNAALIQKVLDGKHHPLTDRKMFHDALLVIADREARQSERENRVRNSDPFMLRTPHVSPPARVIP
jgi:hypothetical protein